MLRERNKSYGTIKFVDIGSDDYSPEENQGLDYETVSLRSIYGLCQLSLLMFNFLMFLLSCIIHKLFLVNKFNN